MSTFSADAVVSTALWILGKATVLVVLVALAQACVRRRASAELRHFLWTAGMAVLLLLPLVSSGLPEWAVIIRTAAPAAVTGAATEAALEPWDSGGISETASRESAPLATQAAAIAPSTLIVVVYVTGVLILLLALALQRRTIRRLVAEAGDVQGAEWTRLFRECAGRMGVQRSVRLLRSRERSMPMTVGTRRPAILIPAIAETWDEERRRAVLLHELAHVVRYDCLTQTLAWAVCTMYWFHPAAWWIARRMRIERELACDDRVIAAGTRGREYAGHLLDIAAAFGNGRAPALAVSMARRHQLEHRLVAALDAARNRSVPAPRVRLGAGVIAMALLLAVAAARPPVVAADRDPGRAPILAFALVGDPEASAPETTPAAAPPVASEPEAALAHGERAAGHDHTEPAAFEVHREAAASEAHREPGGQEAIQDNVPGTWEIRPSRADGTVHLRLVETRSSSGSNVPIDRLEGLTAADLAGAGGPVQFRLRRDAGTFTFEGVVRNRVGAGTFSFTPDPNFPAELAKRGFARPSAAEQYQLARHDIGYAFVDELSTQGYRKPETTELVRAGQHGVNLGYLREMGALGYKLDSLDPLVTLRDHGVTPDYIRALAEQGYKGLAADELRRARDHGVTPEYVAGMREAGYGSLSMEALVKTRDHGVTPEFVRELADAGHRSLPLEQLIRVRDHGVSPEYVGELRQLGYGLPIEELIRARDHGVSVDYVRGMREAGHGSLTMDQLIKARDHGVDLEFVRGMAALGYTKVAMDALIRLRDHGVTPKYVGELKTLGYERLPIEDLVTLRDHGLTPDRIKAANARAGTRLPVKELTSQAARGH